ncbi:hypothetical protein BaRGS_00010020, partial [Batillaria attramentaria]
RDDDQLHRKASLPFPSLQQDLNRTSYSESCKLPARGTSCRQQSFFPRTVAKWNTLRPGAVSSSTVAASKSQI